ncbi:unknown [Bovine gammaherpesvirus 4]|uniref:Tripartite terminase subunit 2 n=3 Tax=Bovine herpesvirus 4 TaxID=10385 RepID=A0A858PWR2_BHV4|nr:unknown [Bovine gammaherpesvirus 4]AAK07987.1 unknown [Bovine gammaherpesvirus 4]QJC19133.1 hypothetical protein [Bovine gammaherpesvirus 4]WIV69354.1 hypothetical protein [Bovine gammaherpesvirus 4]
MSTGLFRALSGVPGRKEFSSSPFNAFLCFMIISAFQGTYILGSMADGDVLDFEPMLPKDLEILAPTIYAKLNILNYCQYLKTFIRHKCGHEACEHTHIINTKQEVIKQIICKIVEADSVLLGTGSALDKH